MWNIDERRYDFKVPWVLFNSSQVARDFWELRKVYELKIMLCLVWVVLIHSIYFNLLYFRITEPKVVIRLRFQFQFQKFANEIYHLYRIGNEMKQTHPKASRMATQINAWLKKDYKLTRSHPSTLATNKCFKDNTARYYF